MAFQAGDTVEPTGPDVGVWRGEVGVVASVCGATVYVRFPGESYTTPFVSSELKRSQQKLGIEQ